MTEAGSPMEFNTQRWTKGAHSETAGLSSPPGMQNSSTHCTTPHHPDGWSNGPTPLGQRLEGKAKKKKKERATEYGSVSVLTTTFILLCGGAGEVALMWHDCGHACVCMLHQPFRLGRSSSTFEM